MFLFVVFVAQPFAVVVTGHESLRHSSASKILCSRSLIKVRYVREYFESCFGALIT